MAWVSQGVGVAISWVISGSLSLAPPSALCWVLGLRASDSPPGWQSLPPSRLLSLVSVSLCPLLCPVPIAWACPAGPRVTGGPCVISPRQLAWKVGPASRAKGGSQALAAAWGCRPGGWSPPPPRQAPAGTMEGFCVPVGAHPSEEPENAQWDMLQLACLCRGAQPGPKGFQCQRCSLDTPS